MEKKTGGRLAATLVDRWWLDLPLVAGLTIVAWYLAPRLHVDLLGALSLDARRAAYGDLNGIITFLAGFASLSLTFYLGFTSRALTGIKKLVGHKLLSMWLSTVAIPWLCALTIWVASLTDRGAAGEANAARWVVTGAVLLVITSLLRNVFVFSQLAQLELKPPAEPTRPTASRSIGIRRRPRSTETVPHSAGRP